LDTDDDEERDIEGKSYSFIYMSFIQTFFFFLTDMFIDDTNQEIPVAAHQGLRDDERAAEEDALAMAYDELLDRALGNLRLQARNSNTFDKEYYTSTFVNNVCLEQFDTDYPLYKVECKVRLSNSMWCFTIIHTSL
jgi:hypothetical protein